MAKSPASEIIQGDALEVLRSMGDQSIHMAVTSPPYWGLRSYGGDEGMIGLEPTLDAHIESLLAVFREVRRVLRDDGTIWINYGDGYAANRGYQVTDNKHVGVGNSKESNVPDGLKPKDLLMMPARVAMALQADGWYLRSEIIWAKANPMPESVRDRPTSAHEKLFLLTKSGDSVFWTHRDRIGTRTNPGADYRWVDQANEVEHASEPPQWSDELIDCPDCQGTGSIEVRESQISMFGDGPAELEPCARCNHAATETPGQIRRWKRVNLWQAHDYFYDADAVRTPAGAPHDSAGSRKSRASLLAKSVPTAMLNGMRSRTDKQRGHDRRHEGFEDRWDGMTKDEQQATGANLRNVWSIATQPFPGAHFATMPTKLIEPCIKAGTSEHGVCADCGAPWTRVAEVSEEYREWAKTQRFYGEGGKGSAFREARTNSPTPVKNTTTGWQPTCSHETNLVPALVLDPFAGAGTVGLVASRLGRSFVGIEINPEYAQMARDRIRKGTNRSDK